MSEDLRYSLPIETAQPWLDEEREVPLNRRSVLRRLAAGSVIGVGAGFEVLWPTRAEARRDPANPDTDWGTVKGKIVWGAQSAPPKPREIDLAKFGLNGNDLKWFTSKGPLYAEDWVVNPKGLGVKWVFVWLMPTTGGSTATPAIHPDLKKPPTDTLTMQQPCTGFAPHAIALRQGQKLTVANDSPVIHAFQWNGMEQSGNQASPPGSRIVIGDLLASRMPLRISCAPHPWESAWMRVFNHPYFAVTDEEGRFEFKNAPKGEHRLMVWHETAGWLGGNSGRNAQRVTIEGSGIVDVGSIGLKPSGV